MEVKASKTAQRRPGREPRRHRIAATNASTMAPNAQRRPGREPRRHHGTRDNNGPCRRPLNEGRGANPGDTHRWAIHPYGRAHAQRRPGREPRRHLLTVAPGTHSRTAQRRPGREPRRHPFASISTRAPWSLNEGRGANPGDTRRHHAQRSGRARSTKAGARTPATRQGRPRRPVRRLPLNEGRGANPGDTRRGGRTRGWRRSLNEGRGANPGDTRVARTPPPSIVPRSTKAGARTPATRPDHHSAPGRRAALNEGRGANPGDTPRGQTGGPDDPLAQRRPGREPRRHPPSANVRRCTRTRSTKAGARTPATPKGEPRELRQFARSTKAGARTPATLTVRSQTREDDRRSTKAGARTPATPRVGRVSGVAPVAQRRPGREPRRHFHPFHSRRRPVPSLNEGRGANPGDTAEAAGRMVRPRSAQRRPGREPRRHRRPPAGPIGVSSLNEGRGANPGDT